MKEIFERIGALQAGIEEKDALLIFSELNRYYLTGFSSSNGAVFITKNDALFFTDSRYIENARNTVKGCKVRLIDKELSALINDTAKKAGTDRIHIEADYVTVNRLKTLREKIDLQIVSDGELDKTISAMRRIKSPHEIEQISAAQSITDAAFAHILDYIKPGMCENEIALELEFFMRKNGAEGLAFDTIIVSGQNSSKPHGVPGDRQIRSGDFITMDFGAKHNGYCSDMTRTIAIGEISDEQRYVYDTVLLAQRTALAKLHAGMPCSEGDALARDVIKQNGCGQYFGHSLGHSLGLFIHESPNLSPNSEDVLLPNMILTVEPCIYIEGKFGVRIEDMALICEGGVKNLTKSPKSLIKL
ncbi:MAG: aminopeptidase P family protein [Clostridia bacterium]|nr:aminopeptidase P family protein [Clostridia bacterium]